MYIILNYFRKINVQLIMVYSKLLLTMRTARSVKDDNERQSSIEILLLLGVLHLIITVHSRYTQLLHVLNIVHYLVAPV